jgi:Effector-associated domain 8
MTISQLESGSAPSTLASKVAERTTIRAEKLVPAVFMSAAQAQSIPVLNNLCLPNEYLDRLRPALQRLGCSSQEGRLERPEGRKTTLFRFTLVNNGTPKALLYLEDQIITVYNREYRLALEEVRDLFQIAYSKLYFFYYSNPSSSYKNILSGEWPQKYRVETKLLPLSDIADFDQMSDMGQEDYIKRELDISSHQAGSIATRKLPAIEMKFLEIQTLIKIVASRPEFTDEGARGRRVFVQGAGLQSVADTFDFDGKPKTVAGDLVVELTKRGLGKLLEMIKALTDLGEADRTFIFGLLERYTFD